MRSLAVLLLIVCAGLQPVRAAALAPEDFAYGCRLQVDGGDGVYALSLPLEVYAGVTRQDLGDLRVFNAAGEAVPHAVRRAALEQDPPSARTLVPLFPLDRQRPEADGDLALRVERSTDGTIVTVDAGGGGTGAAPAVRSYLLDAGRLEVPPRALELQWRSDALGLFRFILSESSDLSQWRQVGGPVTLADLRYNGNAVASRRIPLPGKTAPYLRLDCLDCPESFRLEEVTALSGAGAQPGQWQWLRLEPTAQESAGEEFHLAYRLQQRVAVTSLQLEFPAANSILRATIESRADDGADWVRRYGGLFYALSLQGQLFVSDPVTCGPTSDPYWRLRITADGAGLGAGGRAPRLQLGWRADQLVFAARGKGPFTLAFGSGKVKETAPAAGLLLAAVNDANFAQLVQEISAGPVVTLGGEAALRAPLLAVSWQTILLWGILLAGVVLLALMARAMLREMQASGR